MALSDKVLSAQSAAKRSKLVDDFVFEVNTRNGFFVTIQDVVVLSFDSLPDANQARDDLNNAIASVKTQLTAKFEQEVDDIINA